MTPSGLFCRLCQKGGVAQKSTKSSWVSEPCCQSSKKYANNAIIDHISSEAHQNALANKLLRDRFKNAAELLREDSSAHKNIRMRFEIVIWLAKEKVATRKFPSIVALTKRAIRIKEGKPAVASSTIAAELPEEVSHFAEQLECGPDFRSTRTTYDTFFSAKQMIRSVASALRRRRCQKRMRSHLFSMLGDEGMDAATKSQLLNYIRFVDLDPNSPEYCQPQVDFLKASCLPRGDARTVTASYLDTLERCGLPLENMLFSISDGASVFAGCDNGVHAQLRAIQGHIRGIHCGAHRLSLIHI